MVKEVAEALVGEGRGIIGSRGGAFIDTSTPSTTEVELVTTPEKVGSTTNVGVVGPVITLRPVVARIGGVRETVVISPADSTWNVIDYVEGRVALISSATM